MRETGDIELLRQYAREGSEAAFEKVMAGNVNLVYSVALRKTGNAHAAEEITQAVFIILAQKADALRRGTILSGWLYQTARLTAANYLRTEIRRFHREQEACVQSLDNETGPEVWPQMAPLLEDAMGRLGGKDRDAIVLRFMEGKDFREIGAAFGASENAAKKRVGRALEKLRKFLAKRGVVSTAAVISRPPFLPNPSRPRRSDWQKQFLGLAMSQKWCGSQRFNFNLGERSVETYGLESIANGSGGRGGRIVGGGNRHRGCPGS